MDTYTLSSLPLYSTNAELANLVFILATVNQLLLTRVATAKVTVAF